MGGLARVASGRAPPGSGKNVGCLNEFGPITYNNFIISPKYIEPIFIPSPPLGILYNATASTPLPSSY